MKATMPQHIKLDERHHVEKPLLDQLAGLGWEVIDLTDMKQTPAHTHRESFTEVVMLPVLRERLKVIKPLARRQSGRGGRQAAHRRVTRHAIA